MVVDKATRHFLNSIETIEKNVPDFFNRIIIDRKRSAGISL